MRNDPTMDDDLAGLFVTLDESASVLCTGVDAADFLHRLLTCDVRGLGVGHGSPGFLLTSTGRVELALRIYRFDESCFWLVADSDLAERIVAVLDRFLFAEKVELTALTDEVIVTVQGAHSAIDDLVGGVPEGDWDVVIGPHDRPVYRCGGHARHSGTGYDLSVPRDVLDTTLAALEAKGLRAVNPSELDALRVEAGRPAWPFEYSPESMPLEARGLGDTTNPVVRHAASGLEGITEGKGCYPGQEVIERTLAIGSPPRVLVAVEANGPLERGAPITAGGVEVGRLTSTATIGVNTYGLALIKRRMMTSAGAAELEFCVGETVLRMRGSSR